MKYQDYWITIEHEFIHDPTLTPPAKYRWTGQVVFIGYKASNGADAYSYIQDQDDYSFKVMLF
jgi:hypothetical protein